MSDFIKVTQHGIPVLDGMIVVVAVDPDLNEQAALDWAQTTFPGVEWVRTESSLDEDAPLFVAKHTELVTAVKDLLKSYEAKAPLDELTGGAGLPFELYLLADNLEVLHHVDGACMLVVYGDEECE